MMVDVDKLPNFAIIGASKCGTTSLWTYLNRHPQIFLCEPKEPMFFCRDDLYLQGKEWYASLFSEAGESTAIGEATTSYTYAPHTPDVAARIHSMIPDCRLIYLVRPPIARTYSHYIQELQVRVWAPEGDLGTFEEAIEKCPMLVDASKYMDQIESYLRYFSPEQLKVILLQDLQEDPGRILDEIQRFLEIDVVDLKRNQNIKANRRGDHHARNELNRRLQAAKSVAGVQLLARAVPKEIRTQIYHGMTQSKLIRRLFGLDLHVAPPLPETTIRLREEFRESNQGLAEYLQRDLSHWEPAC